MKNLLMFRTAFLMLCFLSTALISAQAGDPLLEPIFEDAPVIGRDDECTVPGGDRGGQIQPWSIQGRFSFNIYLTPRSTTIWRPAADTSIAWRVYLERTNLELGQGTFRGNGTTQFRIPLDGLRQVASGITDATYSDNVVVRLVVTVGTTESDPILKLNGFCLKRPLAPLTFRDLQWNNRRIDLRND